VKARKNTIRIPKPQLFNFSETLWFLDRNLDDCMHAVENGKARRLFKTPTGNVLVDVSEVSTDLIAEGVNAPISEPDEIRRFIIEWFDLERDIRPFYKLLKSDPDLAPLAKRYRGFRIVGLPDLYECLVWCVMGQQINLGFAYRLKRRFVELYGEHLDHEGKRYYIFPDPRVVKDLSVEELRKIQLPTRKAEYITGISRLFANGEISKEMLLSLKSEEGMIAELMKIRGIGEWTANYTLMKTLGGMNGIPYGDSGVNNALLKFKGIPKKNNRVQVDKVFGQFRGWKTYLVFYLWRSLREKEGGMVI
jgi:DNA-3-methyladenine glycosylase II